MDQEDLLVTDGSDGSPKGKPPRKGGQKGCAIKDANPLCLTCRRACKQERSVLIASCPRYYAGPKVKRGDWKQLSLPIADEEKKK